MKIWKILLKTGLFIVTFIFVYLIISVFGAIIPKNRKFKNAKNGKTIFIYSNGVHLDIGFSRSDIKETKLLKQIGGDSQYIFAGWGDRGFYLDTPTWAELKFSTAIKAMFLPSKTLLHTTYRNRLPSKNLYKIKINDYQFEKLMSYVENDFHNDELNVVEGASYKGVTNEFYEAKGNYFFTYTCNQWICEALKEAGVRTALWSPFDKGVIYQLKKIDKEE